MKVAGLVVMALGLMAPGTDVEKLLREAKFSLSEAIEKAGKDLKEVAPVAAQLKEVKGRALFVVRFAHGEEQLTVSLDAKTGEVVEKTPARKNHTKTVAAVKIPLSKAFEAALKKVAGKAFGLELEVEKDKGVVEVEIFLDGKKYEVEIDGVTGEILGVEQDDDDDDEEDDD